MYAAYVCSYTDSCSKQNLQTTGGQSAWNQHRCPHSLSCSFENLEEKYQHSGCLPFTCFEVFRKPFHNLFFITHHSTSLSKYNLLQYAGSAMELLVRKYPNTLLGIDS